MGDRFSDDNTQPVSRIPLKTEHVNENETLFSNI
jgi:hypothetical protein